MLTVETSGLSHSFGNLQAVDDVALRVPQGSVYGFLGPNGAGKTTTIRLLLGLIRSKNGEIRLFDQPLKRNRRTLLARVGSLVETPSLYPHLTGRENLELLRRLLDYPAKRVDEVLKTVRLDDAAERTVQGYSQGMRQRLGLALALLPRPELLVLDEPTNGLDPAGIREMRELIRDMPRDHGVTVFLSSHLLGEVEQVASHLGIIHRGALRYQGSLAELQLANRPLARVGVADREAARRSLARAGFEIVKEDNGDLLVELPDESAAATVNATLVGAGVPVHHLNARHSSLEEIFLGLTGHEETT